MYELFLESEAASQIDRFVAVHGGDAEDIKQKCYANAWKYRLRRQKDQSEQAWDNWWVDKCLKGDSHKEYDINILFDWEESPEGVHYWAAFDDY